MGQIALTWAGPRARPRSGTGVGSRESGPRSPSAAAPFSSCSGPSAPVSFLSSVCHELLRGAARRRRRKPGRLMNQGNAASDRARHRERTKSEAEARRGGGGGGGATRRGTRGREGNGRQGQGREAQGRGEERKRQVWPWIGATVKRGRVKEWWIAQHFQFLPDQFASLHIPVICRSFASLLRLFLDFGKFSISASAAAATGGGGEGGATTAAAAAAARQ
ncbi:hypothetical protein Mapa_004335 [Marchantia paleacea]|nr:hypothetical protein Mapa_004335 [Marchantia paleacea]